MQLLCNCYCSPCRLLCPFGIGIRTDTRTSSGEIPCRNILVELNKQVIYSNNMFVP